MTPKPNLIVDMALNSGREPWLRAEAENGDVFVAMGVPHSGGIMAAQLCPEAARKHAYDVLRAVAEADAWRLANGGGS